MAALEEIFIWKNAARPSNAYHKVKKKLMIWGDKKQK